jgi:hypothetical protein
MADIGTATPADACAPKWDDVKIEYLILEAGEFIVYIDPDIDVDWRTSKVYDKTGPKDSSRHNVILNRVALLECIPNDHHRRTVRLNFKRMIGEGLVRSLEHEYQCAENILDVAGAYIENRNVEKARFWQLLVGVILGASAGLLALVAWGCREYLLNILSETGYYLVLAGLAGSLGAVLSMIFRMGRMNPSCEAPRDLHFLEASSRVFAGFLSGQVLALAVHLGILFPIVGRAGNVHLAMLLAATVAGASERMAPSLIGTIERSSEDSQDHKRP